MTQSTLSPRKWKKLLKQADNGNAEAQNTVGCYYYADGFKNKKGDLIVEPNLILSQQYHRLAAKQGNLSSQEALGVLLSDLGSTTKDIAEAINWLELAIQQDSAMAAHNLGCIYRDFGKLKKAYRYYKKAAKMGDTNAYLTMGLCLYFGIGIKSNVHKAATCLKTLIQTDPKSTYQRSRENAYYWLAIIRLKHTAKTNVARKMLEIANADDDHEQANDLLNIIGKSSYRISP